MSRRRAAEKRTVIPDHKFKDVVLTKFMNRIMVSILLVSAVFSQQEPEAEAEKPNIAINFVQADDELLLNWSVNAYVGYPVYTAEFFSTFDKLHPLYGLSLGTPFGLKTGLAYSTIDIEIINITKTIL